MMDREVHLTSLCYILQDYEGRVWLQRLADVEDGKLCVPYKSDREDNYFENRDKLYRNDGPTAIGSVGIWDWTAVPSQSKQGTDFVQSYYVEDLFPIRVVVVSANSIDEVIDQLQNGLVRTQPYFCDTFFCYEPKWGRFEGVLCYGENISISDRHAKLNDDIFSLPVYTFQIGDIYNWDDRNLRFIKTLQVGEPQRYITIGNVDEIIRDIVLERASWPLFKETVGGTKAEWRSSKKLVERVCSESLYEAVEHKLNCTQTHARQAVDSFITRANALFNEGDIDVDVLAKVAMQHEGILQLCEDAVAQKWRAEHIAEITIANQELIDAKEALNKSEAAKQLVEDEKRKLLKELEAAQERLSQKIAEIEEYEALGEDTVRAVQQRIADAQRDVAAFIAEKAMFLPQPANAPVVPSGKPMRAWQYFSEYKGHVEDEIEVVDSWKDELNTLHQNLAYSLGNASGFQEMFSAFLYSAHINNIPLLIVGPGGEDVAEILSVSLYATCSGHLTLCNEYDSDIVEHVAEYNERVISVKNMFGKGWSDILPQEFYKLNQHIIWTHPYVEDMIVEPKGLYNYMVPLLSECFVETIPTQSPWPGARSDGFKEFSSKKILPQPLKVSVFKRLGLSRMFLKRMEKVMSDAKEILDNPAREKDMEILFGIMPIAVLTGKTEVLKELMETESGISGDVKTEIARYLEEE